MAGAGMGKSTAVLVARPISANVAPLKLLNRPLRPTLKSARRRHHQSWHPAARILLSFLQSPIKLLQLPAANLDSRPILSQTKLQRKDRGKVVRRMARQSQP